MSSMKLWRIYGIDKSKPYEGHAETKEEAMVNFIDVELGLSLSKYQFNDAVAKIKAGHFCSLNAMLIVEEVLE